MLGFYYASQNQNPDQPLAAEFQIRAGQLIGHISGAAPPYRYTIVLPGEDAKKEPQKVAKDGWVSETLPSTLKKDDGIQIDILDAKDRKLSKTLKFAPEEKTTNTANSASQSQSGPTTLKPNQPATGGGIPPLAASSPAPKASQ